MPKILKFTKPKNCRCEHLTLDNLGDFWACITCGERVAIDVVDPLRQLQQYARVFGMFAVE